METTLVFDYDGTLHNTIIIYERAFRYCYQWLISQEYIKEQYISTEKISSWVGMNSQDMWESFQPYLSRDIKNEAGNLIGEYMVRQIREHKAKWYSGVQKVLDVLRMEGYRMVILSNCKTSYKEANWEEFVMERWFTQFYDCESFGFAPKTEIIKTVQKENPGRLIVIGDRKSDMDCAKVCKAQFVGCLYGFAEDGELKGANHLIRSIKELPNMLRYIGIEFFNKEN